MKFLLDESVEFRLSSVLQTLGHDVTAIAKDYSFGTLDVDVLAIAQQEKRILITNDRDFGELIFLHNLHHSGVIYLRMKKATVEEKSVRLREIVTTYEQQLDQFLVVTSRTVRIRKATNLPG